MAYRILLAALGLVAAAAPAPATIQQPAPEIGAPEGPPDAKYCMRIEPIAGSRLEEVKCWTREQWAENEVDVDKDWASQGVAMIVNGVRHPKS